MKRIVSLVLCILLVSAALPYSVGAESAKTPRIAVDAASISTEGGDVVLTVRILDAPALWSLRFSVKAPASTRIVGAKAAELLPGHAEIGPLGEGRSVSFIWMGNEFAAGGTAANDSILPLGSDDVRFAEITLRVPAGLPAAKLPVELSLSADPDDFLDAYGHVVDMSAQNGVLNLFDKTFAAPVWTWAADLGSASAKFVCSEDASDVRTVAASVSSETTKKASCTENGEMTYTAKVSFNGGVVGSAPPMRKRSNIV